MISITVATKRYGSATAVDNVSFEVRQGESFALLGPNGAGKTSLVKMLLGFTRPTSGTLSINGMSVTDPMCRASVGYCAENNAIPPYLTGYEFLARHAELIGLSKDQARTEIEAIIISVGMQGKEKQAARTYSKGMVQRIGLGAALLGSPKLLILDEPVSGLDPIGIREVRMLLEERKRMGTTILLNSHLLSEVEKVCDTAAIIKNGKILIKESISAIVKDGESLEDVFVRMIKE